MKQLSNYQCEDCGHRPPQDAIFTNLIFGCRVCGSQKFRRRTSAERLLDLIDYYLEEGRED